MVPTKATAYKFLKSHSTAVIATVSEERKPSTTAISYILTDKRTLHFVTRDKTNKLNDIQSNPDVALSIVDPIRPIAVNIIGQARILQPHEDQTEISESMRKIGKIRVHGTGLPPVIKHSLGNYVVVEVTIDRLQYTDFTSKDKISTPQQFIFNL